MIGAASIAIELASTMDESAPKRGVPPVNAKGPLPSAASSFDLVLRDRRARQQSTHPFYWAGFVAAGDWR